MLYPFIGSGFGELTNRIMAPLARQHHFGAGDQDRGEGRSSYKAQDHLHNPMLIGSVHQP